MIPTILLRNQPEETAVVCGQKAKLVIEIGEIERGCVCDIRPRNQVGTLLQHKIGRGNEPGNGEVGV